MKRIAVLFLLLAFCLGGCIQRQSEDSVIFIVASDMGRRGVSEQQNIADLLGHFVEENKIDFLAVAGDPIHNDGVMSVDDEEWNLKIENVYTAPSLHAIPWYVVSGNHEYNGSVQAIMDYSDVSERWNAPARYFSFTRKIGDGDNECLFVFIDTAPLIDRYRNDEGYSDAGEQDMTAQLTWLERELSSSEVRWTIVVGHHPVYAKTTKALSERTDMQQRVGTLLEEYGADIYICGHIHNFQHIHPTGSKVHYIVNSSASQSRPVHDIDQVDGMIFGNPDPGFSVFSMNNNTCKIVFMNHQGESIYNYTIAK